LLFFIELQTILQLADRFIRCFDGFHAVPAEIVRGVLQVFLGAAKRSDGFANFGMGFTLGRGRGGGEELPQRLPRQRALSAMPESR
jgi:hypothetical protein